MCHAIYQFFTLVFYSFYPFNRTGPGIFDHNQGKPNIVRPDPPPYNLQMRKSGLTCAFNRSMVDFMRELYRYLCTCVHIVHFYRVLSINGASIGQTKIMKLCESLFTIVNDSLFSKMKLTENKINTDSSPYICSLLSNLT